MSLRLEPLAADEQSRVAHIAVAEEQRVFSGTVAEAFARTSDGVDFHVILSEDQPVGFFKIDTGYPETHPFAPQGSLGLRAFMVDHRMQGQGIATGAVALLPAYLATRYTGAETLFLTVNKRNPGAIRAYLKGGFTDTGQEWLGGDAGPQHIMHLPISPARDNS